MQNGQFQGMQGGNSANPLAAMTGGAGQFNPGSFQQQGIQMPQQGPNGIQSQQSGESANGHALQNVINLLRSKGAGEVSLNTIYCLQQHGPVAAYYASRGVQITVEELSAVCPLEMPRTTTATPLIQSSLKGMMTGPTATKAARSSPKKATTPKDPVATENQCEYRQKPRGQDAKVECPDARIPGTYFCTKHIEHQAAKKQLEKNEIRCPNLGPSALLLAGPNTKLALKTGTLPPQTQAQAPQGQQSSSSSTSGFQTSFPQGQAQMGVPVSQFAQQQFGGPGLPGMGNAQMNVPQQQQNSLTGQGAPAPLGQQQQSQGPQPFNGRPMGNGRYEVADHPNYNLVAQEAPGTQHGYICAGIWDRNTNSVLPLTSDRFEECARKGLAIVDRNQQGSIEGSRIGNGTPTRQGQAIISAASQNAAAYPGNASMGPSMLGLPGSQQQQSQASPAAQFTNQQFQGLPMSTPQGTFQGLNNAVASTNQMQPR